MARMQYTRRYSEDREELLSWTLLPRSNGVTSRRISFCSASGGTCDIRLRYRDLEEMMLERGLHVDHTTIYRWMQHYAPELEKRCRRHLKATNDSWRVD